MNQNSTYISCNLPQLAANDTSPPQTVVYARAKSSSEYLPKYIPRHLLDKNSVATGATDTGDLGENAESTSRLTMDACY
jgi:hypothetical protein